MTVLHPRRALLSVSDKTGLIDLAQALVARSDDSVRVTVCTGHAAQVTVSASGAVVQAVGGPGRIGLATLVSPGSAETWLRATLTPPLREALDADDCRVRQPPANADERRKREREARLERFGPGYEGKDNLN